MPFRFDVFLSHSSEDKPVVRALARRLRRDGLRVWFDEWELKTGDRIPSKIEEGLERSRVLVLCMSSNAFSKDWPQLESDTFRFRDPLNKQRRFIPLRLDNAPLRGSLRQFLYIDWCLKNRKVEYAKLIEACRWKRQRRQVSAKLISNFGVDPKMYPLEVRTILLKANRFELNGDFGKAGEKFEEATKALRRIGSRSATNCCAAKGLSFEQLIQSLKKRTKLNKQLRDLRKKYKGTVESTLVQVFDKKDRYLYSRPKTEVHERGLLHHTVILIVHLAGQVVFYRRHRAQTCPGMFDFLGGHTADIDVDPMGTARREANEELQLVVGRPRLSIPQEWIHMIGREHQFVCNHPQNRERSTLFVVDIPRHPGISIRITDEAADGYRIVSIPNYELDSLSNLVNEYKRKQRRFADGAERVLAEIARNPSLRKELCKWFPDIATLGNTR